MRNPRRSIFPEQIYSVTAPRLNGPHRGAPAYSVAFPSLSSLALGFNGRRIGIYRLMSVAKVTRLAQIRVGDKVAKVRDHLQGTYIVNSLTGEKETMTNGNQ
jgi:hypothetical protein